MKSLLYAMINIQNNHQHRLTTMIQDSCSSCETVFYRHLNLDVNIEWANLLLSVILGITYLFLTIKMYINNPSTKLTSVRFNITACNFFLISFLAAAIGLHSKQDVEYEKIMRGSLTVIVHCLLIIYVKNTRDEQLKFRFIVTSFCIFSLLCCIYQLEFVPTFNSFTVALILLLLAILCFLLCDDNVNDNVLKQWHTITMNQFRALTFSTLLFALLESFCLKYPWLGALPIRSCWYLNICLFVYYLLNYCIAFLYKINNLACGVKTYWFVPMMSLTKISEYQPIDEASV